MVHVRLGAALAWLLAVCTLGEPCNQGPILPTAAATFRWVTHVVAKAGMRIWNPT